MDIIKRLQLNRNPKDLKSGSIVGAKNIMLDQVNSSITNEYGFEPAFIADAGFAIVGAISCNEELVIFLHNKDNNISKIIRFDDNKHINPVNCNWKYEGGTIEGTFTYNYKKQLIIAVSEHDADHDVPLKIYNLDDENSLNLNNTLEESIPEVNCTYAINSIGSLVCGTYTFFIRFKISEETYTKWFQITDDIIITNIIAKDAPLHNYESGSNSSVVLGVDSTKFNKFYVNENLTSSSSIDFELLFKDNNFEKYQIGYIIKRDTEVLGRIYKEFSSDDINISMIDNNFSEEVNINDFLEIPTQFFNCKNVINYNNRLYISNYKNYNSVDFENISDKVDVKLRLIKVDEDVILSKNKMTLYIDRFANFNKVNATVEPINIESLTPAESRQFVINNLLPYIQNGRTQQAIYIFKHNSLNADEAVCIYSGLTGITTDEYNITFENGYIVINKNGYKYILNNNRYLNSKNADGGFHWIYPIDTWSNNPTQNCSIEAKYSTIQNIITNVENKYNNNRSLIPGQVYNFFIHLIRKDGSHTEGYQLKNKSTSSNDRISGYDNDFLNNSYDFYNKDFYFQCPRFIPLKTHSDNGSIKIYPNEFLIVPIFDIDQSLFNDEYVGYFISYEKIEITSIPVVSIDTEKPTEKSYKYTNSEILYNNNISKGHKLSSGFSTPSNEVKILNTNIYNNTYKEKHLIIDTDTEFTAEDFIDTDFNPFDNNHSRYKTIIKVDRNILYNAKHKTLYRLTKNVYKGEEYKLDNSFMYLPGFYNREKVIVFDQSLVFNATSTFVYNPEANENLNTAYKIYSVCKRNYSHICLNALSIKQDYEQAAVVLNSKTYVNKVLSPAKVSDFLELKACYKSDPVISYTNYNKNTQSEFNKTIYRSDIISDESLKNGFRHFNIENYKNIIENKGNIVNIVGVGLYLLVHTEYSLFVFDRNNKLSDNAQLQIPDTFDIDYKELTPSNEGFGGLKDKKESILTKHGYIWFDRISKTIFMFDGQAIKPLSADIHNILKTLFERTNNNFYIRFAEDYISNRLIITIKQNQEYITLSYSFDTECFISSHDYTFDDNYKTYNNSYVFSKNQPDRLFVYKKNSLDYCDLDEGTSLFETIKDNNNLNSYVDIIVTDYYEFAKTLNSISYIISKNNYYSNKTNIIDQYFNINFDQQKHLNNANLFSGYRLAITTDLTFSGIIDISKDDEVNGINSSKPRWNNGVWNFNGFRENIVKDVTDEELALQNVNEQTKEVYKEHDNLYESGYEKSDMRTTIDGKYFIFRFIFERKNSSDLNLKFETLEVNYNKL